MDRRENVEEENIRGLVLHVTCPMYQNYIFTLRTLCPQEKHGRKIPVYDWVRKRSIFKESGGYRDDIVCRWLEKTFRPVRYRHYECIGDNEKVTGKEPASF